MEAVGPIKAELAHALCRLSLKHVPLSLLHCEIVRREVEDE